MYILFIFGVALLLLVCTSNVIGTIRAGVSLIKKTKQAEEGKVKNTHRFYFGLPTMLTVMLVTYVLLVNFVPVFQGDLVWGIGGSATPEIVFIIGIFLIVALYVTLFIFAISSVKSGQMTSGKLMYYLGALQSPALIIIFTVLMTVNLLESPSRDLMYNHPTYVEYSTCGDGAKMLIKNIGIRKNSIASCFEKEYQVGGKTVYYVNLQHGQAFDCPAGCAYDRTDAIVSSEDLQIIPTIRPGNIRYMEFELMHGCNQPEAGDDRELIYVDGKYRWKTTYNNKLTEDGYGNACRVTGTMISGVDPNDKIDFNIKVTDRIYSTSSCLHEVNAGWAPSGKFWDEHCLTANAIAKADPSFCNMAFPPFWCYVGAAVRKQDEKICDDMLNIEQYPGEDFVTECRQLVEKYIISE